MTHASNLSLARRLGLLLAGNLLVVETLYNQVAGSGRVINASGALRYQSQQIAFRAAQLESAIYRPAARGALAELLAGYENQLGEVEQAVKQDWPLLARVVDIDAQGLASLKHEWPAYRRDVERLMLDAKDDAARDAVDLRADVMLAEADRLVGGLTEAERKIHRGIDALLYFAIVADALFLFLIYRLLRRRVLEPLGQAADMARRFGEGDYAARVPALGDDEIGRLAATFNLTADRVRALMEEQARFEGILAATPDFVGMASPEGKAFYLNPAGRALLGLAPDASIAGFPIEEAHPPWAMEIITRTGIPTAVRDGVWSGETALLTRDGRELPLAQTIIAHHDAAGRLTYLSTIARDISARKHYEADLIHRAQHDALTGLPNLLLLRDRIEQALVVARRHQRAAAVLYLDIDNFKHINDSLGHAAGDDLLKTLAARLAAAVREGDTVARQGGDEFVLLLADLADADAVSALIAKLTAAVAAPAVVAGRELRVTCSIGVALYPRDGDDAPTLLRNADTAVYRAKELGRDTFQFYAAEMNARVIERMAMEDDLRLALRRGEFEVHYQPRVDLGGGEINGFEALVRWRHPKDGLVSPARFIPVAEDSGLIVPLGAWVLAEACRQLKLWHDMGHRQLSMAVNVSVNQFQRADFVEQVDGVLAASDLPADALELEITESLLMRGTDATRGAMDILRALGVTFAIDDFGTGYSSLSYLRELPVTTLKIDQSFVRDITNDPDDATLVRTIIDMAHDLRLRLRVVAEGVETEAQLAFLRDHGCEEMQGYLFSRPLPAAAAEALLASGRKLPSVAPKNGAERTVLLVDRESAIYAPVARLLERDGKHVLHTGSGEEALDLLSRQKVGVVVAGQHLPDMSGIDLLHRVRALHPHAVRVALAGYDDIAPVTQAINEGAVSRFLATPWTNEQLRDQIGEALDHYPLRERRDAATRPATPPAVEEQAS